MGRNLETTPQPRATADFDIVHAKVLRFFPDLVAQLGGDYNAWIAPVGVTAETLAEGKEHATYRQIVNLLERAASELRCPDFGMRLAMIQSGGSMFGPLGAVMKNSATFGDAIDYVGKHNYAHSLAARIWLKRNAAEKTLFVGHDILLDRMPHKSQAMEQILLLGHLSALEITGGHVRVRKVHFRHQPVSPIKTYRSYFGCEVLFDQNEDGVVFSNRDLACPIISPDAQAYASATSFIDAKFTRHRPPLHAEVRGVIMLKLGTEQCSNDDVAAELNMHPRTLHRRLRAEGTSFQDVKDEVRRDLLLYYLEETNLDFALISSKLGFSEQSVMTRRCQHWFAKSPSKMRAERRPTALAN